MSVLSAPFPWFGGKRKVAAEVWARFGDVANYVEPFFGSGAVLLGRPACSGYETINDLDGYVCNFWRAVKHAPDETADWAENRVSENDLHARHVWLVHQRDTLRARLEGDPDYYDPKIAGWWVWGVSSWIGSGFCSGDGPWHAVDGQLVRMGSGRGVTRQLVSLRRGGRGVDQRRVVTQWFAALSDRLRRVRVCSGDWLRVCSPCVTVGCGLTGVFLDPPYAGYSDLYRVGSEDVAHAVRAWAISNGSNPLLRIALCGYDGEHVMPPSWSVHQWSAGSGVGGQAAELTENGTRERIWFSPACLSPQPSLFGPQPLDAIGHRPRRRR